MLGRSRRTRSIPRREPKKRSAYRDAKSSAARLQFLGGAGTVTGSRFLLEVEGKRLLVDCGLYQGLKELRLRNWRPFPCDVGSIDAIALTHAHIDHSGYLPRLCRLGYDGPVYVTGGTADMLGLLLPDAAHLQEEEAAYANRKHYSKHQPALPLFDVEDAHMALDALHALAYTTPFSPFAGVELSFHPAGHLLGSASVLVAWGKGAERRRLLVSGDLGRYGNEFMADPVPPQGPIDFLLIESTYGDRLHETRDIAGRFARLVRDAIERGGVLLIPAFAAGRTQEVLFYLSQLEKAGKIPIVDVYVDSPMAVSASEIYAAHRADLNFDWDTHAPVFTTQRTRFVRSVRHSKALHEIRSKAIILSASGMATGGRVLHHLAHRVGNPRNTVLFAGHQVSGTRGRKLVDGVETIRMLGNDYPVACRVEHVDAFSAHGDRAELLRWVESLASKPRRTFVVHGEASASAAFGATLHDRYHHAVELPELGSVYDLD